MDQERIGRYRLEEVIGVGSFATVHRAFDAWLEDTVALKVLAENHSLNPEVRERFISEGRSLRRISSPHVVTVHDIGESQRQQPFLVLEYADRGTLADRMASLRGEGWTPTRADVLVIARELAAAIEAVHAAQLVHRDLSPGNVLLATTPAGWLSQEFRAADKEHTDVSGASVLRRDERLVVADLGMCKDLASSSGLTVAAGTSGFRPPEQSRGPGIVNTRADIWSLSALLIWLCEGAELPDDLSRSLARSLVDDPEDRHPDVASWLADIEAALQAPAPVSPPSAGVEHERDAAVTVLSGPPTVLRSALIAAVVAALVLGVVGGLLGSRWTGGTPSRTSHASVAVEGPVEVAVGEEVTFTATVNGLDSWVWTLPSGQYVVDLDEISVIARTPGPAHLVLRGQDVAGEELEVVHRLTVTE